MADIDRHRADRVEIHVPESDTRDLTILTKADIIFAIVYSCLFLWGFALTILSI